jgi:RNA polymerase sigma-70 factor, ECF subfamily
MQPAGLAARRTGHGNGKMSAAAEDEIAVERVLGGDTAAFAALVERWQGPLVNLAYRFCRNRAGAEDMAQEAFLRAYRGLRSWRRDAAFSTWLFALATNVYRSEMRRVVPEPVPIDESVTTGVSAAETVGNDDHRRMVRDMLGTLPPKYRDPLVLYYFHDQDVAATATSLELPEGTVKARLSRGRALLKSKLEKRL